MGELQATVECSVEFHKFFNVDLFQRGLYQVQAWLQVSPKLVHQVEVTCGEPASSAHARTTTAAARADGQRAFSQAFQILYRNEEVILEDVFNFKVHVVLDANKLVEGLERAGFQLAVELHFAETADGPAVGGRHLQLVSTRHLKLHLSPLRGLHYHLPVLFDYFHLAAISLTFHSALVAIHQPYIDTPRPKPWYSSPKACSTRGQPAFSTMETVIFGIQTGCSGASRLAHARSVHRSVCSLLLASYESLQSQLATVNRLLPAWQRIALSSQDCRQRLATLSSTAKDCCHRMFGDGAGCRRAAGGTTPSAGSEEDLMAVANSDIAQLCAELILLWQRFTELASRREQVRRSLARQHHTLRVKRFAEAFFTMDNPRPAATGCFDSAPQRYMAVTEAVRRSAYLQSLPPLPVECAELDGDPSTTPVIYEDQYQHVGEFVRRRREQAGRDQAVNDSRTITAALVEELRAVSTLPAAEPRVSHRGQSIEVLQRVQCRLDCAPATADAATSARFVSLNGLTLDETAAVPLAADRDDEPGAACGGGAAAAPRPQSPGASPTAPLAASDGEAGVSCQLEPRRPAGAPPSPRAAVSDGEAGVSCQLEPRRPAGAPPSPRAAVSDGETAAYQLGSRRPPPPPPRRQTSPAAAADDDAPAACASAPEPKQYLKEKLKNNIRLELRVPVGQRTRGHAGGATGASGGATSEPRPAAPAPRRRRAGSAGSGRASPRRADDDTSLRHSVSSLSIPEAVRAAGRRRQRGSLPDLAAPALTSLQVGLFGAAVPALLYVQRGRIVARRYVPAAEDEAAAGADDSLGGTSHLSEPSSSGSLATGGSTAPTGDDSATRPPTDAALSPSKSDATDTLVGPSSAPTPTTTPLSNGGGRPPRAAGLKARLARLGRPASSVLPPRQFRDPPGGGGSGIGGESLSKSASLQFGGQSGRAPADRCGSKSACSSSELDADSVYGSLSQIDGAGPALRHKRLSQRVLSGAQSFGNLMARKESRKKLRGKHDSDERYRVESATAPTLSTPPPCTVLEMFSDGFGTRLEDEDELETSTSLALSLDRKCTFTPASDADGGGASHSSAGHQSREVSCDCYSALENGDQALRQRLVAAVGARTFHFITAKEQFKEQIKGRFPGVLYSDCLGAVTSLPYFLIPDEYRLFSSAGLHLVVCVHGLDGNAADLRLVRTYLEIGLPGSNLEFIMSERNQGDTFSDFDTLTDRLAEEISFHIEALHLQPARISFVGHSLGNIIIRNVLTRPQLAPHLDKLHTFLSLSAPHLGTLYNNSGLVNMGMWFMQKLKKSGSLLQLAMKDAPDVRDTFLYRLAMRSRLHQFRHVLLTGSSQDKYVPIHSSRIDLCKAAIRDHTATGAAYREMVTSIIQPLVERPDVSLVRYDVHHALANNANSLIGRAAHIAALDSELFIEKFMMVAGLKYFK